MRQYQYVYQGLYIPLFNNNFILNGFVKNLDWTKIYFLIEILICLFDSEKLLIQFAN